MDNVELRIHLQDIRAVMSVGRDNLKTIYGDTDYYRIIDRKLLELIELVKKEDRLT